MGKTTGSHIVLAIESAIRGGSICLLDGDLMLGEGYGSGDVSRAEDLSANISDLCESSGVAKSQIDTIAVSRGPGSYTGIRIGIATALGLTRALNCKCVGIEVLRSMAFAAGEFEGRIITAVPFGRHDVAWQEFPSRENGVEPAGEPVVDTLDRFQERLTSLAEARIVIHSDLRPVLRAFRLDAAVVENPAWSIGLAVQSGIGSADLTPIYIRSPAAAGQF